MSRRICLTYVTPFKDESTQISNRLKYAVTLDPPEERTHPEPPDENHYPQGISWSRPIVPKAVWQPQAMAV